MEVKIDITINDLAIFKLVGKFNIEDVSLFEKSFNSLIEKNLPHILIEMSELNYIDSSGIGSLIKSLNDSKSTKTKLILMDMKSEIYNIFKLAYLDKFFTILSKEEAKKKFPQLA